MAPFRAKIGWKKMRMGKNKNYRFVVFLSRRVIKMQQQKTTKLKKLKKYHYCIIWSQNSSEKAKKEWK